MSQRIQGLDGLRAVAVLAVICGHQLGSPGFPDLPALKWFVAITDIAGFGVKLFFVISGFIITHLLLVEEQRTGKVSLVKFWLRRIIRILPPLMGYIGGVALLGEWLSARPMPEEWIGALTFSWLLWFERGSWYLGHTWSLSIEEQFYLFWPLVFLATKGCRKVWTLLLGAVLLPGLGLMIFQHIPARASWLLPANGAFLLAGCFLALLRQHHDTAPTQWTPPMLLVTGVSGIVLAVAPLGMARLDLAHEVWRNVVGGTGLALLLSVTVSGSCAWLNTLLQWRPIVAIGRLSYSLYLWQQLFTGAWGTTWCQRFPQNLLFIGCAAAASYLALERPFFALRQRFRPQV